MKSILTFKLNDELFGIDSNYIQSIIEPVKITKVPKTPNYVMGFIDFRGKCPMVLDIKNKLSFGKTEITKETSFLVINLDDKLISIMVDKVLEVHDIDDSKMDIDTRFTKLNEHIYSNGILKTENDFINLLKIDYFFKID